MLWLTHHLPLYGAAMMYRDRYQPSSVRLPKHCLIILSSHLFSRIHFNRETSIGIRTLNGKTGTDRRVSRPSAQPSLIFKVWTDPRLLVQPISRHYACIHLDGMSKKFIIYFDTATYPLHIFLGSARDVLCYTCRGPKRSCHGILYSNLFCLLKGDVQYEANNRPGCQVLEMHPTFGLCLQRMTPVSIISLLHIRPLHGGTARQPPLLYTLRPSVKAFCDSPA